MGRIVTSLALALCAAWNMALAEQSGQEVKDAPREPAASESAPKPTGRQPTTLSRRRPAPEESAERAWWLSEPAERARTRPQARQVGQRKRLVFRLKNSPAMDVAEAINELLRAEREGRPIDRDSGVVIVPEPVSNSLLVSATPSDVDEIKRLIEQLDQQPQMVLIQMLIAQMTRPGTDENSPVNQPSEAGRRREEPQIVGLPRNSHFSPDRLRREVELGVLELPAPNQGADERLRELQQRKRLEVLSRPQILTLDNQPAFIQFGGAEPVVRGSQRGPSGPITSITHEEVGLKLGVTPRVTPEGLVTMEIDLEMSQLGHVEDGVPIAASPSGQTVRAPRIVTTVAQSTVSVHDGQTVVLGGLTTDASSRREELVIVLTPHIVNSQAKAPASE